MSDLYIVRLYDGWDGEWMDVTAPCKKDVADAICETNNAARGGSLAGKRTGSYSDGDYYAVFPADTKMMFSEGRSLTRGPEDYKYHYGG